jgi:hypothetical protein
MTTKEAAIVEALARLLPGDPLIVIQLFEAVYNNRGKTLIRIPPHLVDRLGEECLLSWKSREGAAMLDADVADVIRRLPWEPGSVPKLIGVVPSPKKAPRKKRK